MFHCVLDNIRCRSARSTLAILTALADAFGKVAESIGKLGDSFAHLVRLGTQGYDAIAARRAYNELIDLRVNLQRLIGSSNALLTFTIDGYITSARNSSGQESLSSEWEHVTDSIHSSLRAIFSLLEEVNKVRARIPRMMH